MVVLCASLWMTSATRAGDGKWNLPGKVVDLHLYLDETNTPESLQFSATDNAKLSYWLNEASKKMWNATEGNLRIGTVYVYNNTDNGKNSADILFFEGPESANANVGGLGQAGTRMAFWMPRNGGNFQVPQRLIQNSLVHEFGHYGFGLCDEYLGHIRTAKPTVTKSWFGLGVYTIEENFVKNKRSGNMSTWEMITGGSIYWGWNGGGDAWMTAGRKFYSAWSLDALPPTAASWTSSIMDIDFASNCTEFSSDLDYPYNQMTTDAVSGLKLPGHMVTLPKITTPDQRTTLLNAGQWWVSNRQEEVHKQSCWATIAQKLGVPNLTSAPSTAMPAGFSNINWVLMGARRSVELCIDRSGSMYGYPMEQAIEGAKLFTNLAQLAAGSTPGDYLGVVDFDDAITVTGGIRELTNATLRDQLVTAIGTIYARGNTSIGGGLNMSRQQLESLGATGAGEMIVLLSDGGENTAPMVSDALPAIVSRGIKVYTISLGSYASIALMQNIADQTHGKHFIISDPSDLQAAYAEINQQSQEAIAVNSAHSVLAPGAELSQAVNVNVGATQISFVLTSDTPGLILRLRSPSGVLMDESSHPSDVDFIISGNSRIIKVNNPSPGVWTPLVSTPAASDAITLAKAENPPVAIPDGAGVLTRVITVPNSATISSINPTVAINHPYIGDLKVTLKSPKGTVVVMHNHTGGGNQAIQGTYGEDLTSSSSLSAFNGQQMKGNWTLIVEDNSAGDAGKLSSWGLTFNSSAPKSVASFDLQTSAQDDKILYVASIEAPQLQYPTPAVFHASVNAGGPVTGAVVEAVITHPDGETQTVLPLYDDGNPSNGDQQGNDGIYSAKFAGFTQSGTYQTKITVNCSSGFVSSAGNSFNSTPVAPTPAPKFTRVDSVGFSVTDVSNPSTNAVQVKSLAVTKKSTGEGSFAVTGLFNADDWQYNPKTANFSISLDGYSLNLSASQFKQKGRIFEYSYTGSDKKLTRKVTISPYVGGTSKCTYSVAVNNDSLGSINYAETTPEIDFRLAAGSISDAAALLMMTKTSTTGSSASYKALSNSELSPALYIQSASAKLIPKKSAQDMLQLLAGIPGWSLPSDLSTFAATVEFGGLTYTFPVGGLVKQRDRSYKATLNGGNITLLVNPEKRLLQLTAKNQTLTSFANPTMVKVTIGAQTQMARVAMSYIPKSTSYTY